MIKNGGSFTKNHRQKKSAKCVVRKDNSLKISAGETKIHIETKEGPDENGK